MVRDRILGDNIPHEFSDQFDTSQSEGPGDGEEREITQEIFDEIDSYRRVSSERFQIPCDFQYFGGDQKHIGQLHRQIS